MDDGRFFFDSFDPVCATHGTPWVTKKVKNYRNCYAKVQIALLMHQIENLGSKSATIIADSEQE
jgi:hypothetical protein